jgi:D-inositol-3-phosphate glycosyltransferase
MRIAMVSEHASPLAAIGGVDAGGQNVHVLELSKALAAAGHEVTVWTRRDDERTPDRVAVEPGLTVRHVRAGPTVPVPKDELVPYLPAFARELTADWEGEPPDIVHGHFWMSGMVAVSAASRVRTRRSGLPVVQTFHALGSVKRRHQGKDDTSPRGRVAVERAVAGRVDRVIATCTDEVFELVRMGADRRRIGVVPCGTDVDRFTADGPAEPRTTGRHRLVAACRLVERKGIADAVTALTRLPDAELHVAGGPEREALTADPEAERLRALAADLGVADRLVLRGRVARDDLPALLRSADVVVCVPWYEPFGIVPLEAMACGIPVVASAVGGQVDSVVDGATGIHVPPRDPAALACAVRDLLDHPERRLALGAAGRRRAQERFSFDRIGAATREVYASVMRAASAVPAGRAQELGA